MGAALPTHTRTYRKLVAGTTINATTLLSTDYLNHFNEIVMMLELAVDMPDVLDEMEEWRPKSYAQHFRDSGFSHLELAIAAYEQAPREYREPFDRIIADIAEAIAEALPRARDLLAERNAPETRDYVLTVTRAIRMKIERASAIVNGARTSDPADDPGRHDPVMEQTDIDALFS